MTYVQETNGTYIPTQVFLFFIHCSLLLNSNERQKKKSQEVGVSNRLAYHPIKVWEENLYRHFSKQDKHSQQAHEKIFSIPNSCTGVYMQ